MLYLVMTDMDINASVIRRAADIIRRGGVVAFPTETVYGLGANAFDEKAVARVFEIKRRPFFDPLILHIAEVDRLADLVTDVPALAQKLIDKFWPGPLTLVLPKTPLTPDIVTAGLAGVAVRLPSNDIARKIVALAGAPIAAPSANLFGRVSPTSALHVREQLKNSVDMIIDGGECSIGVESTIISFMDSVPALLRPGGAALEEIEGAIGKVFVPKRDELVNMSPGRGDSHYTTGAPIALIKDLGDITDLIDGSGGGVGGKSVKIGLLAFEEEKTDFPEQVISVEYLSKSGDLREAACNLFAAMRRLDASGADVIAAMPVPNYGLGLAINDRLYRASKKNRKN